jgi:hypothetical protein
VRCGAFDAATGVMCVLNTDHDGAHVLRDEAFDEITRLRSERDAAVRDAAMVREIRGRQNVVVEVSPELLTNGAFTDQPLHIMLTDNGDGTHLLTFRVSDTIRELRQQLDASQKFSDEAVRAHTECERRLRKTTACLAACEKIVEAAVTFVSAEEKAGDDMTAYTQAMAQLSDAVRLRAAVAAETQGGK